MTRLAAVTGGTGFLGRYIVSALADAGWRVRMLARRPVAHPQIAGLPLETVFGDLSDHRALRALVDGADTVVHAAGLIKAPSAAAFRAVNVDGTANLAAAVADGTPAARVVLVSSLAAREPHLSPYARTKRAGEERLTATLGHHVDWVIVRPGVIYGPWDTETLALFRAVARRFFLRPRIAAARIALLHACDAAAAVAALAGGGPAGMTFELADERIRGYSWDEIASAAEAALQSEVRSVPVPGPILRAAAAINLATARLLHRTPMLTPGKVREILHADWGSTAERQPPRELWRPTIGLARGFRDTLRWYEDRHLLQPRGTRRGVRADAAH